MNETESETESEPEPDEKVEAWLAKTAMNETKSETEPEPDEKVEAWLAKTAKVYAKANQALAGNARYIRVDHKPLTVITQSVPMLDENSALRPNMPQRDDDEGGKPKRLSFSPASSVWGQMGRAWTSGDRNARTTASVLIA